MATLERPPHALTSGPKAVPGGSSRIPALDGLRGLAVLVVILHHSSQLVHHAGPGLVWFLKPFQVSGWIGVDLFFVLSGFLITGILIRTKGAENRARSFYARRVLRIFPIYYLTLTVILLAGPHSSWLSYLLPYRSKVDVASLLFFGQSWIPLWHGGAYAGNILGHFWSLGVEEDFYFIWPWVIWTIPERFYMRACLIGIGVSLSIRLICVAHYGPDIWAYMMTSTGFDCLLLGAALAVLAVRFGRVPARVLISIGLAGAAILSLIAVHNYRELGRVNAGPFAYTVGITGYALLFGSLVGAAQYEKFFFTRLMNVSWLRRIGTYSYGMYIYHVPLFLIEYHLLFDRTNYVPRLRIEVLFLIGVFVSTYLVAWASFEWFERPIQNLKRYFVPETKPLIKSPDASYQARPRPL